MSLLIDALRRADEAKRAAAQGGESAPAGEGISLAPLERPTQPLRVTSCKRTEGARRLTQQELGGPPGAIRPDC